MVTEILRYDPRFLEEAVFLSFRGHPKALAFQTERDRLYEIPDTDDREKAFQELNVRWFDHLGLAKPIETAVHEQPLISSGVKWCVVACAAGKGEEGAELFVNPEDTLEDKQRRTVRILLRPESLLTPEILLTFLRHELFHIMDMLDPLFGYEPALPAAESGPTYDRLLQARYRVLWDSSIDGRMVRRRWAPESIRAERLDEFSRAFPMLEKEIPGMFSHFFDQEPHTHAELISFACNPRAALGLSPETPQPGSRCPLCGFPTYSFSPKPERLGTETIARINRDFPRWHPFNGLCLQCADLYQARTAIASMP